MDLNAAVEFIRTAVPAGGGTWADFGAGQGAFTRALALVTGPQARIFAVDRDPRALRSLQELAQSDDRTPAEVIPVYGDFRSMESIRELAGIALDGALFANSLHFAPDADLILVRAARLVRPGGRVVVVEYEDRPASPWVPHPIPVSRLRTLAQRARLDPPIVVAEHPSSFGGAMYCAVANRPDQPME